MKTQLLFNSLLVWSLTLLNANCQSQNKYHPVSLILTPFATGLDHPVEISHAGDHRLFIVEQSGYIRIIDSAGNIYNQAFLDIDDRVKSGGEQGLLGLAFHPDYHTNGYFYVNYTGTGDSSHISRFSVSSGDPDVAEPSSELKLMTIFQPYQNHNGGDLVFGPDGYLYIGLGDGGSAGDPGNRAQNPMELLGKMLRIDVDGGVPYAVPESNPFFGEPDALNEIWALGLRNPWHFSFDRLTGDLWIGDVGQNAVEEIDYQPELSPGGENYGWRCYEGNNAYNLSDCSVEDSFVFPVYTYSHSGENSCSVTGGYVYRGTQHPGLYGKYFFTDYCSDKIWSLQNVSGSWISEFMGQYGGNNFSTFGEDESGELYIAGYSSGAIYRIDDSGTGFLNDNPVIKPEIYPNPFKDILTFDLPFNSYLPSVLRIFTSDGKPVYQKEINKKHTPIYLHSLPAGMYFAILANPDITFSEILVKY